jgi:queuine/archaeosine tRNA-ribosyltransferase
MQHIRQVIEEDRLQEFSDEYYARIETNKS